MRRLTLSIRTLAVLYLLAAASANAFEFNGYAVLTSDYVYRGVTYSAGDPAAQLGGELSFESGFYGGAWLSTVDIDNGIFAQRDLELDYYLGYEHDIGQRVRIGVAAVFYTFPGAEGFVNYDYEEISLSLNVDDTFWLDYAYAPDIFSFGRSTHNIEAYAQRTVFEQFVLSGGIGYYDTRDLSGNDYLYWQLGVTRGVGPIDLDLRYHEASDWVLFISDPDRVGARFAFSVRYQF